MKNLMVILGLVLIFTSCEKSSPLDDYAEVYGNALDSLNTTSGTVPNIDYQFDMILDYYFEKLLFFYHLLHTLILLI